MKKLLIEPQFEIDSLEPEAEPIALGVGPDRSIYILSSVEPSNNKFKRKNGATLFTRDREDAFFKTKLDRDRTYKIEIWRHSGKLPEIVEFSDRFNITSVQPLGKDFLLVCPRCYRRSKSQIEMNGRIFSRDGLLKKTIILGDGINDVQVAKDQTIWVSYFDEGVLGNYGWKREPVGASGLVQWSEKGDKLYEFVPVFGLPGMIDCYAINVDLRNDVWCCYYSDFPLVRLHNKKIQQFWQPPVRGSHCFAVELPFALFFGSYDRREQFKLVELLDNGKTRVIGDYLACTTDGMPISIDFVTARGATIYLISGRRLYAVNLNSFWGAT